MEGVFPVAPDHIAASILPKGSHPGLGDLCPIHTYALPAPSIFSPQFCQDRAIPVPSLALSIPSPTLSHLDRNRDRPPLTPPLPPL